MIDCLSFAYSYDPFLQFGIDVGTGESCGMGLRLVLDLNDDGIAYMEEFLGSTITIEQGTNWRRGNASIMLPHSIFNDLAIFLIVKQGHEVVVCRPSDHVVTGYTNMEWDAIRDRYLACYPGTRVVVNRGSAGTRNQHVWSGRIT